MSERRKILLISIAVLTAVSLAAAVTAMLALYLAAFEQMGSRLSEMAQGRSRLIEAVASFDAAHSAQDHPEGPAAATLSQIVDAHERFAGLGRSGEMIVARRDGDHISFLVHLRHGEEQAAHRVALESPRAEPMRRALGGQSGTLIGADYRGTAVLAAHEPVAGTDWGVVAKIDLAEIRAPFLRAAGLAGAAALLMVTVGSVFIVRLTSPLIARVEEHAREVEEALARIETLRGIVPICGACKKIRDDHGYWNRVEVYVSKHSLAEFSHGLCPDCAREFETELSPGYSV